MSNAYRTLYRLADAALVSMGLCAPLEGLPDLGACSSETDTDNLLLESGDAMLLESGDLILLESA